MKPSVDFSVNHLRSHEIEVRLSCQEECQFGIFHPKRQEVVWRVPTRSNIAEFRGLSSETVYRIASRNRYKRREWLKEDFQFGEHVVINVSTCPENMEGMPEIDDGACFARTGFYGDGLGSAKSCEILASTLPTGALSNMCNIPSYEVQNLSISAGFWRASLGSSLIFQCPNRRYCAGTANMEGSPDQYCSNNHTGIYCSDCVDPLKLGPNGCILCDSMSKNLALHGVIIVLSLLAGFEIALFAYIMLYSPAKRDIQSNGTIRSKGDETGSWRFGCQVTFTSVKKHLYINTKVRIFLGYLQVLLSFQRVFRDGTNLQFSALIGFLSGLSVFELLYQFPARCFYDFDHYDELLAQTLIPIVLLALLKICIVAWRMLCGQRFTSISSKGISQNLLTVNMWVLFLIYPKVSETIFSTFWCENFPTALNMSTSALVADYRLSCLVEGPERTLFVIYAGFMVLVYPVGVLVFYGINLHRSSPKATKARYTSGQMPDNEDNSSNVRAGCSQDESPVPSVVDEAGREATAFLTRPYISGFYWFEIYELLRKLCMTSLLHFIQSNVLSRAASDRVVLPLIALNMCIVFCIILTWLKPYKRTADLVFALISLCMLMPATQIKIMDPFARESISESGGAILVWVEFALLLCTAFVESIVMSCKVLPEHGTDGSLPGENARVQTAEENTRKLEST